MAKGELGAAFEGLTKEMEPAAKNIAESMARHTEDTAQKAEASLAEILAADGKSAQELESIGKNEHIPPMLKDEGAPPPVEADSGSPETSKSKSLPDWLKKRFEEGNKFNEENRPRYPHNEVYLKSGKRVDSYRPGREIVERKYSQLGDVKPKTANGYIGSLQKKYAPGEIIADTAKNRSEDIAGQPLRGQHILEVPPQNAPIPKSLLDHAKSRGVIIRDTNSKVYR